jgi:thymidine phosphorylase
VALITAMDRPLGRAAGNALEVVEAIEALRGGGPPDVRAVTLRLAGEMLALAGVAASPEEGVASAASALDDGRALETMRRVIEAQGGDPRVLDDVSLLPTAPVRRELRAPESGVVERLDTRAIGEAVVVLGAGRARMDAEVDPSVGLLLDVKPGVRVSKGEAIGEVHAADQPAAERAAASVLAAIRIGEEGAGEGRRLLSHRVTAEGVQGLPG